jgi:hypothetical protein
MRMQRTTAVLAAGALWAIVACAQQPVYQQPPAYQPPPPNLQQPDQSAPTNQTPPNQSSPPAYQQQPEQPPPGAREPTLNVSPYRHGNIARAQEYSRYAFDAMTQAQQANEFDMGGHAERAKQLLAQANDEMKLAAEWANHRH